ncbi:type IV pilin [Natrialbaceae archaeon GCM10025810]|uniref:type IV pilin n=1 Tax=Halovalidus salilacus TaxID=3075124 RepID=UPI003608DDAE
MTDRNRNRRDRGVNPALGVTLLIGITVGLAAVVAVGASSFVLADPVPTAAFDLEVDADRSEVVLEHVSGDPIDVEDLEVAVEIDGERLARQPPVPYVGASGFEDSPGGPFNPSGGTTWRAGERASFRLASTNDPSLDPGDEVSVTLVVDGATIATLEETAG